MGVCPNTTRCNYYGGQSIIWWAYSLGNNMFIINWVFDKLGYMPKIDMQVGKVNLKLKDAWPFPEETLPKKKPVAKKRTTKKPAVVAKTTRAKKVK